MIKKTILFSMLAISALGMDAKAQTQSPDRYMMPLEPTYLHNTVTGGGWDSNWFIEAKGGASAFIGSPVGCGDIFDRITPTLQVGIGKWFTPSVGGRIEFQGLQFKNANLQKMDYQFVHADFMYNLTSTLNQDERGISRWDVIPLLA